MNEKTITTVTLLLVLLVGVIGVLTLTKTTETAYVVQTTGPLTKPTCLIVGFTVGSDGMPDNVIVQNWNVKTTMGGDERCRNVANRVLGRKGREAGGCMKPCTLEDAVDWELTH